MRRSVLLALFLPSAAWAWPGDAAWVPVIQGAGPVQDASGDAIRGGLDLVGDANVPTLSWWADDATVQLRLHLAAAPAPGPAFGNDSYGVLFDVNGDDVIDGAVVVGGSGGDVSVLRASGAAGLAATSPWTELDTGGSALTGASRVVDVGDGSVFVDLQVSRASLLGALGVDDALPTRWIAASWSGRFLTTLGDVAGCDAQLGACDDVAAVASTALRIDEDADGLTFPAEVRAFTNPADGDSDDDGVLDGVDPAPLTCDGDHDGLRDPIELGLTAPSVWTDPAGCFVADADPSTTTNPRDADSDGGGLLDGEEDFDHDGQIGRWETDPNAWADDLDQDGDRIADVLEGGDDPDNDGLPSLLDPDSDGDGLSDSREGRLDPDADDIPPWFDPDSDNDGIPDGLEGTADPDRDGLGAFVDLDSDDDGVADADEGVDDYDDDGTPNELDGDSDDDGRPDASEGLGDVDCDGEPDLRDYGNDDGFCDTDLPVGAVDTDPFGDPDVPVSAPKPGRVGGGAGCDQAGGRGVLAGLLALIALRRRRAIVGASLLAAGVAEAAEVDAQRFRPAIDGWQLLVTEDGALPGGAYGASVMVDHADRPLVLRSDDGDTDLISAVTTVRLLSHVRVGPWVRFGIDMPLHLAVKGFAVQEPVAVGDMRIGAKVRLLDRPRQAPVALAAVADVTLPSGAGTRLLGERIARGQLGLALRVDPARAVAIGAEIGVRSGTAEVIGTQLRGPELTFGGGLSVSPVEQLALAVEVDGAWQLCCRNGPGSLPTEVIGSVRGNIARGVVITLGGGGGVVDGLGVPSWRALAGIGFSPSGPARLHALRPSPAESGPIDLAPPEPEAPSLVVHVVGLKGEDVRQAVVDVEDVNADGLTDESGRFRTPLDPGSYGVLVGFPGREAVHQHVIVPEHGPVEITVVLQEQFEDVLQAPPTPVVPPAETP